MKQIIRTNRPKTTLSAYPDRIELRLGTDIEQTRIKPFLDIIDDMISRMIEQTKPFYGHFRFSKDRVEVTWSRKEDQPENFDLTYARRL